MASNLAFFAAIGCLCLLSYMNIIGMYRYHLSMQKRRFRIYMIVGARKRQMLGILVWKYAALFSASFLIAVLVSALAEPLFELIQIKYVLSARNVIGTFLLDFRAHLADKPSGNEADMQPRIQPQHTSQGERFMKTLYLIYRSCSKHFVREIFLIFQITVVIILLNTAITPFVNAYRVERVISDGMPENAAYYSRPTFYGEQEKDTDPFGIFEADDRVASVCLTYRTHGKVNGQETDIILYNKGMFEHFSSVLKSGKWTYDTSGIILNAALRKYMGGHKATVDVADGAITFGGEYDILGTANGKDIVYSIDAGGSTPETSQLGVNLSISATPRRTTHRFWR